MPFCIFVNTLYTLLLLNKLKQHENIMFNSLYSSQRLEYMNNSPRPGNAIEIRLFLSI
jgi:hypothetical protein